MLYQAHEYVGSCQSLSGSVSLARLGLDAFRCGGVPSCRSRRDGGSEHRLCTGRMGIRSSIRAVDKVVLGCRMVAAEGKELRLRMHFAKREYWQNERVEWINV